MADFKPVTTAHLVAVPFPGRGHINPMINFCKLLAIKRPDIIITLVVTEEWHGFLISEEVPHNISFGTIPNVLPSELVRAADFSGFVEATLTKMEEPVERLIDQLALRPMLIIYDFFLMWIPGVGSQMNIPVASFWPMSATVFSMYQHRHLLVQNGHFPVTSLSDQMRIRNTKISDFATFSTLLTLCDLGNKKNRTYNIVLIVQGENEVDYIPGVPTTRILDLPSLYYGRGQDILHRIFEALSLAKKAQFFLFSSVYELEQQVIDALKAEFSMPVYAIGPSIPYFKIKQNCSPTNNDQDSPHCIKWLDSQPNNSVLYISQGSFLSVSSDQLDEIVAGVLDSEVRYLWVSRMEASGIDSEKGLVVPWCDQLRVLCHPSVGGFWSHCGWNSTKEGVYAGVPMLTLPILSDQFTNSKIIVDDWKIGWRVKRRTAVETLVTRVEIAKLVKGFMDLESDEGKEMRKRVKKLQYIAQQATAKGGSSEIAVDAFIANILPSDGH